MKILKIYKNKNKNLFKTSKKSVIEEIESNFISTLIRKRIKEDKMINNKYEIMRKMLEGNRNIGTMKNKPDNGIQ